MTHIRALTLTDLSQVQSLAETARREGFLFVQRFADEMTVIPLDTPAQWFFGIFEHEQLCAIGGVTPDPYVDDPSAGRIRRVYVMSTMRGRGLGRQLLDALEARARDVYSTLRLNTDTANAAAFYEHRGYQRVVESNATHIRVASPLVDSTG